MNKALFVGSASSPKSTHDRERDTEENKSHDQTTMIAKKTRKVILTSNIDRGENNARDFSCTLVWSVYVSLVCSMCLARRTTFPFVILIIISLCSHFFSSLPLPQSSCVSRGSLSRSFLSAFFTFFLQDEIPPERGCMRECVSERVNGEKKREHTQCAIFLFRNSPARITDRGLTFDVHCLPVFLSLALSNGFNRQALSPDLSGNGRSWPAACLFNHRRL